MKSIRSYKSLRSAKRPRSKKSSSEAKGVYYLQLHRIDKDIFLMTLYLKIIPSSHISLKDKRMLRVSVQLFKKGSINDNGTLFPLLCNRTIFEKQQQQKQLATYGIKLKLV
ncbi:hypothetical protein P8452_11979 [Trifolium repens]|nr:hypothetical protein P8452_11979 [Trifolium repens]